MREAAEVLALVVAVVAVAGVTRRLGGSPPLVLVVVGVAASFVPGVPAYALDPELVLVGLLPPLLYAAAIRTSLVDIRVNREALGLLAIGAVVFTTLVVGLAAYAVLPGLPLAAAFALGAVVAPPDAVAATAIARRVGMPRRLVSILEGESLLNDATALVALRTAIAAIAASVTLAEVAGDFVLAAGGGLVVGVAVAAVLGLVRRQVEDPVLDTTLSVVAPFVAYLPAELVHGSGVLAVVVTGLLLGHKSPYVQSAASRLSEQTYWRTISFVLENVVFLLIGLQLRDILNAASDSGLGLGRLVAVCAVALAATVLARVVWVFGAAATYRFGPAGMRRRAWSWPYTLLVSWAGMRGVVTLAAAFVLPASTPHRETLVLAAFVVVAGTLLLHGLTLPLLVRRLALPGPDPGEDALQVAALTSQAAQAGLERLGEVATSDDDPDVLARLEARARERANAAWERLGRASTVGETPNDAYRRLRLEMLAAERAVVLAARDAGTADEEVLRDVLAALDVEESMLDRLASEEEGGEDELVSRNDPEGLCDHLAAAASAVRPRTPEGCESCLREGTRWVHLRLCLDCGYVGCCDSSPERHAAAHHTGTAHPVIRSFEPGEAWRWCYVDALLG